MSAFAPSSDLEYTKGTKSFYCDQITHMYEEQLYSNVLNLGGFLLTLADKATDIFTGPQHLQVVTYCADSAYNLQEYARAESYYRKALQMYKTLMKFTPQLKQQIPDDCNNDLKYKVYLCHLHCKKPLEALNILQSIPAKQRTSRINMALGKLYTENGMERAAITCYKEVLRECPVALDAIEALLSLGLREIDIVSFLHQSTSKMPQPNWFQSWLKANSAFHSKDLSQALALFNHLQDSTALMNNHSILVSLGKTHMYLGDYQSAIVPLKLAHMNDPINMNGMDALSFLFWSERKVTELEKLMCKLVDLNYTDNKSEPWIALAYFAQITNRSARGLYFAHRGAHCPNGEKNPEGFLAKGHILLDMKKYQDALDCFREAMLHAPFRFEPHKGIVDCYISMHRYRDALTIATSASKKIGQSPRTLTMCASAMQKDPLTVSKAKTYLEKALNQDPNYLPAIFMLVEIWEGEGMYTHAINLLQKQTMAQCCPPSLHLKLADLLCKHNMEDKAADHFAIALRLDPTNRDAKEGLSRLDPASNRTAVHESPNSYELEDIELDDDEDEHDVFYREFLRYDRSQ